MTARPPYGNRLVEIGGIQYHLPIAAYHDVVTDVIARGTVVDADVDRLLADMYEWETGLPADESPLVEHDTVLDFLAAAELD